jgi:hypothetical protein
MDGDEDSDIDLFVVCPVETAEDSEPWVTQVDTLRRGVTAWQPLPDLSAGPVATSRAHRG